MSTDEAKEPLTARWSTVQAYQMAAVSLALGLGLGYLARGHMKLPTGLARPTLALTAIMPAAAHLSAGAGLPHQNPPEFAARAASDVLERLRADPNNFDLLVQAGNIYLRSRVFSGASEYYGKALQVKDDAKVRNDYANALFYGGNTDGALRQYEAILRLNPKDAQALFNRGMVRWRGKQDAKGAIESWKLLLKTHPETPRRAYVERMIARVSQNSSRPH